MRPKIIKTGNKFFKGDVVRANIHGVHTIILLEDFHTGSSTVRCLPICNFTGSKASVGEFELEVTHFKIPDSWFKERKAQTFLRCNTIDCVPSIEIRKSEKMGNVKDVPGLWNYVCNKLKNCDIAPRIEKACDCYPVVKYIEVLNPQPCDCNGSIRIG